MLTLERAKELLDYDPETGVFTWRVRRAGTALAGTIAGRIKARSGYREIKIDDRHYLAHRLAFLFMTGAWPEDQVDHINLKKNDNRWKNLRPATPQQNARNRNRPARNDTGLKGVVPRTRGSKPMYEAYIRGDDGKKKYFGIFDCPAAAHLAYVVAAYKLHGSYARMT